MADSFDARDYLRHLRANWRFVAIACCSAVAIALAISMLLPKKYTATARAIIVPPGGADQRVAVAVTPIYLESLKTYERFASSDSLFQQTLEHFGLRGSRPLESLKRSVLRVEIPRNTRILEISATLPDPKKAQAVAAYLAQQTVELSRATNSAADRPLTTETERQLEEARATLDRVRAECSRAAANEPTEGLPEDIDSMEDLRAELNRDVWMSEALIAEDAEREKHLQAGGPGAHESELDSIRSESRLASTRLIGLQKKIRQLDRELHSKRRLLSERSEHRDALAAARKDAEAAFAVAASRVRDVRAAAGNRGEQLNIIDPGITPERPSSPNIPLNVSAALFVALSVSITWLSVTFGFRDRRRLPEPVSLRTVNQNG